MYYKRTGDAPTWRCVKKAPKKRLDELSIWDAIILRHISNAASGDGASTERESLVTRIEGKPKSSTELEVENDQPTQMIIKWKD